MKKNNPLFLATYCWNRWPVLLTGGAFNFRSPATKTTRASRPPLGEIPQGWEVKKLGQLLELNYGKALKKDDRRDGTFPVYGSSGIVATARYSHLARGPGIIVGRKET